MSVKQGSEKQALEQIRKLADEWLHDADLDAACIALKPVRPAVDGNRSVFETIDTRLNARDVIQRLRDMANGVLSPTFKPRTKHARKRAARK